MRVIGAATLARDLGRWQPDEVRGSAGRRPGYRALADGIRLLIADGRIPLGTALPSERDLAVALELSRTTITSAYTVLREGGYLASRQGSRSTVTLPDSAAPPRPTAAPSTAVDLTCAAMSAPADRIRDAYADALRELPSYLHTAGLESLGLPVLREAVAQRYRDRGVPTTADQIMITTGAQQALVLVLALLAAPGERVLIDHPTYTNAIEAIKRTGARPIPVPLRLESKGWDLGALRSAARQTAAKLAYVVPDFHNPTGFCLDEGGRAELVRIAGDTRMTLVVDETMTDLGLDAPTPPPVARFAAGARADVVTIGSMSKAYWSGLRIGWIRADVSTVNAVLAIRSAIDLGSAVLEQVVAAELLADPDSVLPARRERLRHQRAVLVDALAEELPEWRCDPGPGGMALWVQLPEPLSTAIAATAPAHGVLLAAGPRFGLEGAFERYLRLPYAVAPDSLRSAVTGIAAAYRALGGGAGHAAELRTGVPVV
ncbi:PLP-dependent aminotransferase family protein [Rhodococcus sp. NPDC003318]|uniref:MocR-like transcription factor YczR n=1 Tax=Rhodococcus sp. NPDC003318 TaxID=3364503 RepID=UPI003685DE10